MTNKVVNTGSKRKNLTVTGSVSGSGSLLGIWVSSASATPTIKVEDGKGTLANTFTPVGPNWYPLPVDWVGDLTVTISGTVDCTVVYN
jgi:hypothetical protein